MAKWGQMPVSENVMRNEIEKPHVIPLRRARAGKNADSEQKIRINEDKGVVTLDFRCVKLFVLNNIIQNVKIYISFPQLQTTVSLLNRSLHPFKLVLPMQEFHTEVYLLKCLFVVQICRSKFRKLEQKLQ